MRPTLKFVLAGLLLSGLAGMAETAAAAPLDGKPKILLHVRATTTKNQCATWGNLADCQAAVVQNGLSTPAGPFYFTYLLAARGNVANLAGLQCGITYQTGLPGELLDGAGVDIFGWTLCATLEFVTPGANAWPRPGGGNLITWDSVNKCQTGDVAVAGYFYMAAYSNDVLRVVKRPVDNSAKVADCTSVEAAPLQPNDLGYAAFSAGALEPGCNPCVMGCQDNPVPATPTTWSGVKTLIGS